MAQANIIPIFVVYRKNPKGKAYMDIFEDSKIDDLQDPYKRKPLIPNNYTIEYMCVGGLNDKNFNKIKKKYKITKITKIHK